MKSEIILCAAILAIAATAQVTNTNQPPILLDNTTNWVVKWDDKIETNESDWRPFLLTDKLLYETGCPMLNHYCYTKSRSNGVQIIHTNLDWSSNIWMTMSNLPKRVRDVVAKTNFQTGQITREIKEPGAK